MWTCTSGGSVASTSLRSLCLTVVFEFALSDDIALQRCLGRAAEEGRPDDTPEVIAKRLRIYREQTEPIVDHYRRAGVLKVIRAERGIDEVNEELAAGLAEAA